MSGPEHYQEAERLRDRAKAASGKDENFARAQYFNAAAQVHATLAQVAATMDTAMADAGHSIPTGKAWQEALS